MANRIIKRGIMKFILLFLISFSSAADSRFHPSFKDYAAIGLIPGWHLERKFGSNPDIDIATVPEDIWPGGGVYPFPTAALTTTMVSDSTDDTSAGTGCRSVKISGLDAGYNQISETKATNGTSATTLSNSYFRILRASCVSSGSSGVNAGILSIKHGGTSIAIIGASEGRTLQAVYTVAAGKLWLMDTFYISIAKKQSAAAVFEMQVRPFATQTWQTVLRMGINSNGNSGQNWSLPDSRFTIINQKSDLRVRITETDTNDIIVSVNMSGFLVGASSPTRGTDIIGDPITIVPNAF